MNEPFFALRVSRKHQLTPDIVLIDLVHPEGLDLPVFTPGAHITVQTPKGLHRSYSLCGQPKDQQKWQIAVKRENAGRGGSCSMFDDLLEGDQLQTHPWLNLFELKDQAKFFIFVAGGIGITPIMSMMRHLLSMGKNNFQLYYCTRDSLSTAFLEQLNAPEMVDHVKIHHDHGDLSQALDLWPLFENPNGSDIYCCGPTGLMDSVRDMTGHWPSESIHFESFGVCENTSNENNSFDIILNSSGRRIHVSPECSILDALRSNGESVSSSCESGTCGSCRTGLISGEAEHRDYVLLDDEKDTHIMVCVSRALTPELVLDL